MSLASDLIRYLGGLTMAGGDRDGEPFRVLPWERRLIRGAFGQPGNVAFSCGRANGKSAVVAGIAAAVVDPADRFTGAGERSCAWRARSIKAA